MPTVAGHRLTEDNGKKLAMWSLMHDKPQQEILNIILDMTSDVVFEKMVEEMGKPSAQRKRMKMVITTVGGYRQNL